MRSQVSLSDDWVAQYLFDKLVIFDIGGDQVQVEKSGHPNDETGCSIGYKPVIYVVRSISTFPLYPYPRYRNGYLALSTLLIDGIENKIDPGDPLDKDIYGLPEEELAGPGALRPARFLKTVVNQ